MPGVPLAWLSLGDSWDLWMQRWAVLQTPGRHPMARRPDSRPPIPEPWGQRDDWGGPPYCLLNWGMERAQPLSQCCNALARGYPFTHLTCVAPWGQRTSREQSGSVMFRALKEKRSNSEGEIR